jgi:hypothetical protein
LAQGWSGERRRIAAMNQRRIGAPIGSLNFTFFQTAERAFA